jgi:hypothetical protein
VVVMLVALVVVGRLQAGNLAQGDAAGSQPTKTTGRTDATPVTSGLAVTGRVALPGPAAAVAVGEGAVWVLLEQGTLLRVDPDRHQVTGRLELEAPAGGMPAGPLAVGAGAVWVGTRGATVTVRVDPARLRVTGRLAGRLAAVARGVVWSYCCRRGDDFVGFGRIDAHRLRPRPPLVVTDASGRRQPVGWLAVDPDALWTVPFGRQRLWRVPLGAARPAPLSEWVASCMGWRPTPAGCGCCRRAAIPTARATRPCGCGAWTSAAARSPPPSRCRSWRLAASGARSGSPLAVASSGCPVRTQAGCRVAAFCCRWIPPLAGRLGGCATRLGSSRGCWRPGRAGCGWRPRRPRSCM